jgi:diguanylate cyclase (GGDEF)-like protein
VSSINESKSVAALAALRSPPAVYGTFQGTELEFARYCSEQFESEVSLKGLLRKLVVMMSSWLGLERVEYFSVTTLDQGVRGDESQISFPGQNSFDLQLEQDIVQALKNRSALWSSDAYGIFRLSIQGVECWCARFAGPRGTEGFLVWTNQDFVRPPITTQLDARASERPQRLDFLIESAQHAAKWLLRLDHAQALLYEDDVTGLFNFRYLDVALDSEFRRLQRFHSPFSVLFIDIDNFKQVNDIYGHLVGSSVLRQVGAQIRSALRDVDVVIRYGGDEFVVVLIGTNSNQALQAAERVRNQVSRFGFLAEGHAERVSVTASIGVASCPQHARDKRSLLKLADETMYAAKRSGKNRVIMVQDKSDQNSGSLTLPRGAT